MHATLRAYVDLFRLQFFFAWPLLFCSGYLLATTTYGGFSWFALGKVALIGFFGFEAGLVLNDYIDRTFDAKDVERNRLTRYWRLFGTRPIPDGLISPRVAAGLVIGLVTLTAGLILTLPYPHSIYVLLLMFYCYAIEIFYQEEKREQKRPFAQIIGRTDFALFPVAGYLCVGSPDVTALLFFVFFYPFALAHLGVNDLIDVANDRARGMKSVPVLFSETATAYWIFGFTALHIVTAFLFMAELGWLARMGILAGLVLLLCANGVILRDKSPDAALRVLPCFHVAMVLYAAGICAGALVGV
ncbi:MAG: prenyltransferase [Methanomicrobiales archaeon HGW-Methanomicrobiales-3]|jgi:4-hydroxybenzoate polyprenyltransferase|nr:MAG: prenyltransferase [Methanomicrobiales archaeon HGW-Methanomicrobiales-3]